MSGVSKFKRQRASTRQGRSSAERRAELEEIQLLLNDVLRLSAAAGRTVAEPFSSADPFSREQLLKEEEALRKDAEFLDRPVGWSEPELFAFIGEPELGPHETRASRAGVIVKRVNARLAKAVKDGFPLERLLGVQRDALRMAKPRAGGLTTFGFAHRWGRKVGFEPPSAIDSREAEVALRKIEEGESEKALKAEFRAAEAQARRVHTELRRRRGA